MPKTSSLGAADLVRAVADAAERWTDADFPARVRTAAAIVARTGYTLPVVEFALDRLFRPLRAGTLERAICEELGSLDVLDRFVDRRRAYPVGKVVVISSHTTIGVAIVPAIYALCAKCTVFVKDLEDALVAAYFQTLVQERPELAAFVQARSWHAGSDVQGDRELPLADAVVAFGRDETLAAIRETLRPNARFVGYGRRASVGYVARDALDDETKAREIARGVARDVVLYDGEGCMSLHALFLERGGGVAAVAFARLLIEALEEASIEFPAGRLDPRVSTYGAGAMFRAAAGRGSVLRTRAGDAMLIVEPPLSEPPPFLPRILPIYAVDEAADCEEYVRSHGLPLEAFAVVQPSDDLAALAARLGAVRLARFGEMQAPSPALHHGGRSRIADFVRWVDA